MSDDVISGKTSASLLCELVYESLNGNTKAKRNVFLPRDTPIFDGIVPCIEIKSPSEISDSLGKAMPPAFTTITHIAVVATIQGKTLRYADDVADKMRQQIRQLVLSNQQILQRIQQVNRIRVEKNYSSEGEEHICEMQIDFFMEYYDEIDPFECEDDDLSNLEQVNIHLDSSNIMDATGTYDSQFPDSVTTAPRTTGPDGRDEGYLEVNTTQ